MSNGNIFPERTAEARENQQVEKLSDTTVVDVDVHLSFYADELQRDIADRMDDPYAKQLKYYLEEGSTYGYSGWASDTWDRDLMGKAPTTLATVTDPEDIRGILSKEFHIDYPIVDPLPDLNPIPQNDRAVAIMRATNEMLIERILDRDDHIYGLLTLIPHDPAACAEEIDRLAEEDQIVGAFWNTSGVKTPLGDPQYDVVYQAAEDAGIPLVYHGAATPGMEIDFPILQYEMNTYFGNHSLTHVFSQLMNLTSLLENGIPEKFPDLEFVFKEVGIAWITMMYRLNREYKERKPEIPLLEKTPEEYIRDQFYISTQPLDEPEDDRHIKQLLKMVGPEMLMFSTDYPHFDFDSTETFIQQLTHFSDEERERILSQNAAEVYGIDV
jgi:predicted TIM-barrel fold metal-dependent hydrolase